MTIGSSMSSGYCSLDEDLEDCFFTAKTSFFRSAPSKGPAKNVTKAVEEKPEPPTVEEIKEKIEKYNAKVTNCLLMKLVGTALLFISAISSGQ